MYAKADPHHSFWQWGQHRRQLSHEHCGKHHFQIIDLLSLLKPPLICLEGSAVNAAFGWWGTESFTLWTVQSHVLIKPLQLWINCRAYTRFPWSLPFCPSRQENGPSWDTFDAPRHRGSCLSHLNGLLFYSSSSLRLLIKKFERCSFMKPDRNQPRIRHELWYNN